MNYEDELLCAKAKEKAGMDIHTVLMHISALHIFIKSGKDADAEIRRKVIQLYVNSEKTITEAWNIIAYE